MSLMYLVCKNDVASFPLLKTTEVVGDKITLDGDITLKPGKKFAKIAIIVDSGEIIHTSGGFITAKAFGNKMEFFLFKNMQADEWVNNHINTDFIAIIKEKVGVYRVLGNLDSPAQIAIAEGKTGKGINTEKVWSLNITDETGDVAPYYFGEIKTTNSDFNNDFNNDFN